MADTVKFNNGSGIAHAVVGVIPAPTGNEKFRYFPNQWRSEMRSAKHVSGTTELKSMERHVIRRAVEELMADCEAKSCALE